MVNFRKFLWRCYRKVKQFPDNRTEEYWDAAATIYPEGTICTSADKKNFESLFSIIKHPSVKLSKDMIVLDVGCGIGRSTPYVAPKVLQYIGVDYSKNMVQKARRRHRHLLNAHFIKNDGWLLADVQCNAIDLAYSELVFQHMSKSNIMVYISEVLRVLKPQGIFIAQIPRKDYFKTVDPEGAEVYGMTKEEVIEAFIHYRIVEFLDFEHEYAYFLMRAAK